MNIFMISNINWAFDLYYNLFDTIFSAKKRIRVFLNKTSQLSRIFFKNKMI